ncbi:hypothetical protein TA3x_001891 [Tundrisphaera sp. TA3]|uniref:hypothetical protein n=1 Tax=Tundrisphaera sp. TA3 TaxID=3435775 RepID=UPI003EBD7AA4
MSRNTADTTGLESVLADASRGVLGMVDELIAISRKREIHLLWEDQHCRIRPVDGDPGPWPEVPMPRSVFRAILARISALCNERSAAPVSPYGGEADIVSGPGSMDGIHASFANTPDEQRLDLVPLHPEAQPRTDDRRASADRARPLAR